jgi:DNA processing protein
MALVPYMIDVAAQDVRFGDDGYPMRLAALADAPSSLWIAGAWRPGARAVAVVGARAATIRGLEFAYEMGRVLGEAGVDVISGGALGVDSEAHRGALDAGGRTVAVLGTGIDVEYPVRHHELFARIRGSGGALITQFPPGSAPRRSAFPQRNKIIAALADLVVVVEAGEQSGSLHTARAALALGRRLAAVPGSPGADALLCDGARAFLALEAGRADDNRARAAFRASDVLCLLDGRAVEPPPTPDDPDAARLLGALDDVPRDVGDLAFRAGLAVGTCAAMVIDLELVGLAARTSGGRYIRLR